MTAAISLIVLLAAGWQGAEASSRSILQAPAPAPASAVKGAADGVMELTAAVATFVNGTALQLQGVPNTTAWVQFSPSPKAGAVDTTYLASAATADNKQKFLRSPQSSLSGSYNGNKSTVLLQLDSPKLDAVTNTLYFDYKVLPTNETGLLATGGTVNSLVAARNGAEGTGATPLLPYVTPGSTAFYNATLSIDVVGIQSFVSPQAAQKAGLIRVPLGGDFCCFGGWGWYG